MKIQVIIALLFKEYCCLNKFMFVFWLDSLVCYLLVRTSTQYTKVVCLPPPFLEDTASGRRMREEKEHVIFLRPQRDSMFMLLVGVGDSCSSSYGCGFYSCCFCFWVRSQVISVWRIHTSLLLRIWEDLSESHVIPAWD